MIRGVRNGPSPVWLQQRLTVVGLRPINALVDVTNLISYDRARPLHVYDRALLVGDVIEARLGKGLGATTNTHAHFTDAPSSIAHTDEQLIALDGKTYDITPEMCVIADAGGERPVGMGGVMGGASTGCSEATTEVFVESAWFDPIRTAQTGRTTGIASDAQYRFARGVDPQAVVAGLELATRLILEICGGEASEILVAGEAPHPPGPIAFDRSYVKKLSGLDVGPERIDAILTALGFAVADGQVTPPSWRRDVGGKADWVEEVARIEGFAALPAEPLPTIARPPGGVLTVRQTRMRNARRALAALGYSEAVTWSFLKRTTAAMFGGGTEALLLANPIAADLECMRPSVLPNLIEAAGRNARRGFADLALFEIGPLYRGDQPADQAASIGALVAPHPARHWSGEAGEPLFELKADLMALLEELGAPPLQLVQMGASDWWRPGRSARLQLGPKTVVAEFGELHPRVLKALDVDGPMLGFEIDLDALPEPKKKAVKTKPALSLSPLMPLTRDFAFVVDADAAVGDLVRAVAGIDKQLIEDVRVFDVYRGPGVPQDAKSVAIEVVIQPREKTLTEAESEARSARSVAVAGSATGAKLRS
jgi:phenylalanyl-tRNA synthetase beta chain